MKWLILIILISCSHKLSSYKSEAFVKNWDYKFGPLQEDDKNQLLDKFKNVEEFYADKELHSRFETYLSAVENEKELMAHAEFSMMDRYKREKRRRAVEGSADYENYKTKHLKQLAVKLKQEKEKRIIESVGQENFEEIKRLEK